MSRILQALITFSLLVGSGRAVAATAIVFEPRGVAIPSAEEAKLDELAAACASDSQLVVSIDEKTTGLPAQTENFLRARTRALKIFRGLVVRGVDPARIELRAVASNLAWTEVPISTRRGETTRRTTLLQPQSEAGTATSADEEFRLRFPKASAEHEAIDAPVFARFLATVGQPGRDALVIEGHTDPDGSAYYNAILGEMRALRIFELLVRAGVSPSRVDAIGRGVYEQSASNPERRIVILRWTADPTVAAAEAPQPATEPPPAIEPPSSPSSPAPEPAEEPTSFTLIPFGGILAPTGELKRHARSGAVFGLGIGYDAVHFGSGTLRVALAATSEAKLEAKDSELNGPLRLRLFTTHVEYVLASDSLRPYAGLGAGLVRWRGTIVDSVSGASNSDAQTDASFGVHAGLGVLLIPTLELGPDLSWHRAAGSFDDSVSIISLRLRWRI